MNPTREQITEAIRDACAVHALNPALMVRQCAAESSFDQAARSSCGAIGLFQLMPATAAEMRIDPADWKQNIVGGARYMAWLLQHYQGDYARALAAYNWGVGKLDRLLHAEPLEWRSKLPAEPKAYLNKILGAEA